MLERADRNLVAKFYFCCGEQSDFNVLYLLVSNSLYQALHVVSKLIVKAYKFVPAFKKAQAIWFAEKKVMMRLCANRSYLMSRIKTICYFLYLL